MSWPRFVRLCRVEPIPSFETLGLTFAVRDAESRDFFAYATALRSGTLGLLVVGLQQRLLVDLQASDNALAGTTGRTVVDGLIAERVARRLAHARAGAIIFEFNRQGRRRAT